MYRDTRLLSIGAGADEVMLGLSVNYPALYLTHKYVFMHHSIVNSSCS